MTMENPFDGDYVNKKHMEQFAAALAEDDLSSVHITSLNDWAPVKQRIARKSAGRRKRRKKKRSDEVGEGFGYRYLRWPAFLGVMVWLTLLTAMYALVRVYVALYEYLFTWTGERQRLRTKMRAATRYEDWVEAAKQLDDYLGLNEWKNDPNSGYYDGATVLKLNKQLKRLRCEHKDEELAIVLQGCVKENFAGTQGAPIYSKCYLGTKDVVAQFNSELVKSINYISTAESIPRQARRLLFRQFQRNYGKSALCLSGGAAFTYRHFGVVKALLEQDLLPPIISGTSGGGLIAALACTRTNEELKLLLVPELADKITACHEPFTAWAKRAWRTGARFDAVDWAERCSFFTMGSLTFEEAYKRTGKVLNISTVPADPHSPVILCNHITSPNCVIWSALLASAAVPGILNPVVLMMKTKTGDIVPFSFGNKWKDGSLRTDIPIQALNNYFNVKFAIVSQVNPHISLFHYAPRGTIGRPVSHRRGRGWRGGFVSSAIEDILKLEIRKWLKLCKNLNLTPRIMNQDWSNIWLQRFDGNVTLWPKIKLGDFWNILADPDRDTLAEMMQGGEKCAFPRINFIKHQLNIEHAIERGRRLNASLSSASDTAEENDGIGRYYDDSSDEYSEF